MRSQCGAEEGMSVRQGGTSIGHRGRREHRWILVWQAGIVSQSEWCRLCDTAVRFGDRAAVARFS
jgi:hypothetical protein